MSHTYAILEISKPAYDEIRAKLAEAGYDHAFHSNRAVGSREVIDMHGVALAARRIGQTRDELRLAGRVQAFTPGGTEYWHLPEDPDEGIMPIDA